MKIAKQTLFIFLVITSISSTSIQVLAQNLNKQAVSFENVDRINGNHMIERLGDEFIKNRKKGKLSKPEYFINRENLTIITFNGLDYLIKNNRVIGIQGLALSTEVLAQITQKLVLLDSAQYSYSEKSDNDFQNERLFLLSLKMLSTTTRDIAALTKTNNPSLNLETKVVKMRLPNVDKSQETLTAQSLVQLAK
ncbi:hypothetical protein ASE74_20085 [Pedobacter sp. Leaf216]|uniref:hypothetical protein n=1 Tax=Pedobacter sp. Leaf216 TaxID=1735684 RepID=UPI0006F3BBAF|nr:hypothetical protein [Pedobacter sp. Leaf216]KQM76347.1 hypothetical protein ASE74_20085 [Pedobacter sp. Leaf216]